jgi:L-asparaginase II
MQPVPLVQVLRSGFVESIHLGSVAVTDADGNLVASTGDPDRIAYARSSMKPLQATVSLSFVEGALPNEEIAIMCASHNGEPVHLEAMEAVLRRAGLTQSALRCPPAWPLDEESARAVGEKRPAQHNCSGKHAGMLLACVRAGFPTETYRDPDHPLQQAVLRAVTAAAGVEEPLAIGVDGCGVPVHALPLRAMATIYARLATGALPKASLAVDAMRAAPYLVAGRDRVCTAVMEAADVIVKVGAEGLVCAGLPGEGLGVAITIEDGNPRALDPSIIHALRLLGVVGEEEPSLERFARPPVLGGGRPVGELAPVFDLERH